MSADGKMEKTTTKDAKVLNEENGMPSLLSSNRVLRSIQLSKGNAADGRRTNGSGADLMEGTSGTTMSAIAPMTIQNADFFRMKPFQTSNLKALESADQLDFTELIDHCLANLDPIEFMSDIGQSIEIRSRLAKNTMENLDKKLSECAKRLEYKKGQLPSQCQHPGCLKLKRFANMSDLQNQLLVHRQQNKTMLPIHSSTCEHNSYEARGTLLLKMPTFAALNNDQLGETNSRTIKSSTVCGIGNLKWHLELRKGENGKNALYANCNEKCTEHFWFCNAKFTIYSSEGPEDGGKRLKIKATNTMYAFYGNNSLLVADTIDLHLFHHKKKCQNWLIVEVDLLRVLPKMFALNTNIEVKMANGTKVVAVNKQGLASVSSYFENFFYSQWREKGQEQFVIHEGDDPNFDIDTFQLMIYAALSQGWMVPELLEFFKDGSRMSDILKLAFKYDIPPLVEYCQNQLILNLEKYPANLEMVELADQLNLTKLIDHSVANFDPLEFIGNIGQGITIRSRLEKSTRAKLDEQLKECAKTMEYKKDDRTMAMAQGQHRYYTVFPSSHRRRL